jgi:hypothetical protein
VITATQGGLLEAAGNVTVDGGSINTTGGDLALLSIGDLTVTNGGSLTFDDAINFDGLVSITSGGMISALGAVTVNATGEVHIDGGTAVFQDLDRQGGALNFLSGSLTINAGIDIGPAGHFVSSLSLGSDQTLITAGTTTIAQYRTLTLNGGTLDTGELTVNGIFQFNQGTLKLSGPTAFEVGPGGLFGSQLTLGTGQRLIASSGPNVSNGSLLTLNGGTLIAGDGLTNAGNTVVNAGSRLELSRLTNAASGVVIVGAGALAQINDSAPSLNDGEITLGGSGAKIDNQGSGALVNSGLIRGDGTITGPVALSAGGEIRVQAGDQIRLTGLTSENNGRLMLQQGTLEFDELLVNGPDGNIVGRGTLITSGGLVNRGDIALSNGQTDVFGDLDNQDTGRVIISGNAAVTFWGDVAHSGAQFQVSAGSSATFFGTAPGSVSGGGQVNVEADISPSGGLGAGTFGGDVHFGPLAVMEIEVGGLTPGSQFDVLNVIGAAFLDGEFDVQLINGFVPTIGDEFEIIAATGGVSGVFTTLADDLTAPSPGLRWDILYGSYNVILKAISLPLAGDYNSDGIVDAADYVVWRHVLGQSVSLPNDTTPGIVSEADYDVWRAHFGQTAATGSGSYVAAVPEPSMFALAALALAALVARRRMR